MTSKAGLIDIKEEQSLYLLYLIVDFRDIVLMTLCVLHTRLLDEEKFLMLYLRSEHLSHFFGGCSAFLWRQEGCYSPISHLVQWTEKFDNLTANFSQSKLLCCQFQFHQLIFRKKKIQIVFSMEF